MLLLLFLFLPFYIQADYGQAPGMYPAEEMSSDVITVPRNPYQMPDADAPPVYQFYYEKDEDDSASSKPLGLSDTDSEQPSDPSYIVPTLRSTPVPASAPGAIDHPQAGHYFTGSKPVSSNPMPSPPGSYKESSAATFSPLPSSSSTDFETYSSAESHEYVPSDSNPTTVATNRPSFSTSSSSTTRQYVTPSPNAGYIESTDSEDPLSLHSAAASNSEASRQGKSKGDPSSSSVVYGSDEDTRSGVEEKIEEEFTSQETKFDTETIDSHFGESRKVIKTPSSENSINSDGFDDWDPVAKGKSSSGSYTSSKHEGYRTKQVTISPIAARSYEFKGDPTTNSNAQGRKRNCCACCDDYPKKVGESEKPSNGFKYTGQDADFGNPKPVITDNGGFQETLQGSVSEGPYQPQTVTVPDESQTNPGYVPQQRQSTDEYIPTLPTSQPYSSAYQPSQRNFEQYTPAVASSYVAAPAYGEGCPCAAPAPPPTMCCQPITPCCLPAIPCCPPPPPIPCCPQPAVCCQPPPPPCCQVQVCCSVPVIPLCFRSCPSCPCRRRLHKNLRMKRSPGGQCQRQCSASGQVLPGRVKRQTPGCRGSCTSSPNPMNSIFGQQSTGCGTCSQSHKRVKRLGCLPCLGRKKREIEEEHHKRVKRLGCLPCLGKRKKRSLGNCHNCSNLGGILHRAKRTICLPCGGRKKRETEEQEKEIRRAQCPCQAKTVAQAAVTVSRQKRSYDEAYDSVFTCDKSCCDYDKCDKIRAKRLDLN